MIYHVITTPECNLCCAYCGEKAFSCGESINAKKLEYEAVPSSPVYSQAELNAFVNYLPLKRQAFCVS